MRTIVFTTDIPIRPPAKEWCRYFSEEPGQERWHGWSFELEAPMLVVLRKGDLLVRVHGVGFAIVEQKVPRSLKLETVAELVASTQSDPPAPEANPRSKRGRRAKR